MLEANQTTTFYLKKKIYEKNAAATEGARGGRLAQCGHTDGLYPSDKAKLAVSI